MNVNYLNTATFIGIDAHQEEHTACAISRFEEEKGTLQFKNSKKDINKFLKWISATQQSKDKVIIGIEGGGNARHALVSRLLDRHQHVYEVNPLFTKQRRAFGTKGDKSDIIDAKAIAQVLSRKVKQLPKLGQQQYSANRLCLRKTVWFYEKITFQGASLKTQLKQLEREKKLSLTVEERDILKLIIRERKGELKRIQKLQNQLKGKLSIFLEDQGKNLTSIKGIDTVLAAKIVAHANGIERFSKVSSFIRYAGIAPLERSSGKTKRHTRNRKGNRKLNSALYLVAVGQLKWNPKAKEYLDKKLKEGKTKKHAIRCLMKRISCIIYGMLKSGEEYIDQN